MITLGYKTKLNSFTRAATALGIGLVMVFGNNAPDLVVKLIAAVLIAAGLVSLGYGLKKRRDDGVYRVFLINAGLDILVGLLLFLNPHWIAGIIVYAIGILLILFGGLQLIVLAGAMSLLGAGFSMLILSVCAVIGGAFLLFNPFTLNVMSIIAGCLLIVYGVSELLSAFRMDKAKTEYEIRRTASPSGPNAPVKEVTRQISLGDAKEVEYEKVDIPEDIDD